MESIGIHGIISLYEYPAEWDDATFEYWWCPEVDEYGYVVRKARMSDGEKRSRLVMPPFENLITNAGINLILLNLSYSGQGQLQPVTQILSVGNGTIAGVARTDTAVAGDGFGTGARKAPASIAVSGFTTTITTNFASTDATAPWTNLGWYGWSGSANATTTTGSGKLMTHALFNYNKGSSAIAVNYVFSLSN